MSVNHQFPEYSDQVLERYIKTVPNIIAGIRVNPNNPQEQLSFLLQTNANNFDFTTHQITGHTYEDDVLELYSEKELKLFARLNRPIIENGLIKKYEGNAGQINTSNLLSDEEVQVIAMCKPITALKETIAGISSEVTLKRILEAAEDLNRPHNSIRAIQDRITELSQDIDHDYK